MKLTSFSFFSTYLKSFIPTFVNTLENKRMKIFLLSTMVFFVFQYQATGQDKFFHLKGKIIDAHQHPVPDVHIINYRDFKKVTSQNNGEFNIWVERGDSLMVSHISYYRKIVYADSVKNQPEIVLQLDTVNIVPVNIFTKPRDEKTFADKNINSWEFSIKPSPTEAYTEKERIQNVLNRENGIMKSEANSLRIATFSPSEQVGKVVNLFKRRKNKTLSSDDKNK